MKDINELKDFYITSDTWFGRDNILYVANRINTFSNVGDMNTSLIKNWNKKVKKDDVVIHLGNFAWDPVIASKVLSKLNGHIYFVCSNDDTALLEVAKNHNNVNILENQIVIIPNHDLVLCHYPMTVWPGKDTGTIHIHGHTVYSHKTDLRVENRINACTYFWGFSPIKISTIKEFINEKE
jgi:calcineurin-like phosphoesterase family protein